MPNFYRLILASGSPRRRELLTAAGAGFTVLVSDADESADPALSAQDLVKLLSVRKAEAAQEEFSLFSPDLLILAADTVVESPDGAILGKPEDAEHAKTMLRALSGRAHRVYSGFTLLWQGGCYTEAVCSTVRFCPLSEEDIADYIASGEPMGKAGSYAIQGLGGAFVDSLEGDFSNVVGLPITAVEAALHRHLSVSLADLRPLEANP